MRPGGRGEEERDLPSRCCSLSSNSRGGHAPLSLSLSRFFSPPRDVTGLSTPSRDRVFSEWAPSLSTGVNERAGSSPSLVVVDALLVSWRPSPCLLPSGVWRSSRPGSPSNGVGEKQKRGKKAPSWLRRPELFGCVRLLVLVLRNSSFRITTSDVVDVAHLSLRTASRVHRTF